MLNDTDFSIIAISRELTELRLSLDNLSKQIPVTGTDIRSTISQNTEALTGSVNNLVKEIKTYSTSSDKHAKAITRLTFGLVFVGLLQAIIFLIK